MKIYSVQPLPRLILHNAGHTLHVTAWTFCLGKFGLILLCKTMIIFELQGHKLKQEITFPALTFSEF